MAYTIFCRPYTIFRRLHTVLVGHVQFSVTWSGHMVHVVVKSTMWPDHVIENCKRLRKTETETQINWNSLKLRLCLISAKSAKTVLPKMVSPGDTMWFSESLFQQANLANLPYLPNQQKGVTLWLVNLRSRLQIWPVSGVLIVEQFMYKFRKMHFSNLKYRIWQVGWIRQN